MICHSDCGKALRRAQAMRDVSIAELAKELDCHVNKISRWRHTRDMKFSRVLWFCNRFDLTLEEFDSLGR